jgi:hypothetical protein
MAPRLFNDNTSTPCVMWYRVICDYALWFLKNLVSLKYEVSVFLVELRRTTKQCCQNFLLSDWHLNMGPAEYYVGVPTVRISIQQIVLWIFCSTPTFLKNRLIADVGVQLMVQIFKFLLEVQCNVCRMLCSAWNFESIGSVAHLSTILYICCLWIQIIRYKPSNFGNNSSTSHILAITTVERTGS